MSERAVLVTGAASGIGRASAIHLVRHGRVVFAGVRRRESVENMEQEDIDGLFPVHLDVTDEATVSKAVRYIEEKVGTQGLAGLVNNAGIVTAGPLEYIPLAEIRRQMEVNVYGPIAVTQAFLPLLRQGGGRVVNVGSIAGRSTFPFTGPYNASKYALEAVSDALRMELRKWGIQVSIIEPGVIKTPIWDKSLREADRWLEHLPEEGWKRYGIMIEKVREYALTAAKRGASTQAVVRAIDHALHAGRPKTRYVVGWDARLRLVFDRLPDRWKDSIVMWVLSGKEGGRR